MVEGPVADPRWQVISQLGEARMAMPAVRRPGEPVVSVGGEGRPGTHPGTHGASQRLPAARRNSRQFARAAGADSASRAVQDAGTTG